MAVTLNDFYVRVLRELNVVTPNGSANSDDLARVQEAYPEIHAELLDKRLVAWGVAESIPEKYVQPLIKIVAYALTPVFTVPEIRLQLLKAEGELDAIPPSLAERKIRKRISTEYVPEPIKTDYY
jgi:NifB/MoaA-like Fe-S oxidoreductase